MITDIKQQNEKIKTLYDLAKFADYSFLQMLNCDPEVKKDGVDHNPREVSLCTCEPNTHSRA